MRPSCLDCARKHVAQCELTWTEAQLGHPLHIWYSIAHLAEAEAELLNEHPGHAAIIREHRLALIADYAYPVPTLRILEDLTNEEKALQGVNLPKVDSSQSPVLPRPLDETEHED